MSQRIMFTLNGESYYSPQSMTILDLLTYFNYKESLFVLELNHLVCNQTAWDQVRIQNNDKIEIVTIVGGG